MKVILPAMLAAAALAAVPQSPAPDLRKNGSLSLASIKPYEANAGCMMMARAEPNGKWAIPCVSVKDLVQRAYGLQTWELTGLPVWALTSHYSVQALFELTGPMDRAAVQTGLRQLLAERFGLKSHREQRQLKILALVPNSNRVKLKPHGTAEPRSPRGGSGFLKGTMNMKYVAQTLSAQEGRPVLDQTGLAGEFEIDLAWTPEAFRTGNGPGGSTLPPLPGAPPPPGTELKGQSAQRPMDPDGPGLNRALRDQLGLRLEERTAPVSVLVVDSLQRPSAN